MIGFQEKKKIRSIIYSKLFLLALFLFIVWLGFSINSIYKKYSISREAANKAAIQVEELEKRELDLRKKVDGLESTIGVENEIRNKYLMNKDGEKTVVLIEDELSTVTSSTTVDGKSWWRRFVELWSE